MFNGDLFGGRYIYKMGFSFFEGKGKSDNVCSTIGRMGLLLKGILCTNTFHSTFFHQSETVLRGFVWGRYK